VIRRLAALAPCWLALGGGGYNVEVVPRAWTLALAVMADIHLPAELPADYRRRYGGRTYHDETGPVIDEDVRDWVRRIVEEHVAALRKAVGLD
jgi:hypothetical protein